MELKEKIGTMRCPQGAVVSYDGATVDSGKRCKKTGNVFETVNPKTIAVVCPDHEIVLANADIWEKEVK